VTTAREVVRRLKWVIAVALCALAPTAAAVAASGPTHLQVGVGPAPLLVPIPLWLPLGAAIFASQMLLTALCLRSSRRQLLLTAVLLLSADVLLVALIRASVGIMGSMDYSESFFRWRWYFLALAVLTAVLPVALWSAVLRAVHRRPTSPSRSLPLIHPVFKTAVLSWVAAGAIILAAGADFSFLPRPAGVTRLEVLLPGLAAELDGLRIAAIADHHVGSLMTPRRARKRLASLPRLHADLVVELGDITDMDPRYQSEGAKIVGECEAPLGTYAVAGNFDVRCGTDSLREELTKNAVTYLENEAARVSVEGADLWIVGVGDPWTGEADLEAALASVPPAAPMILLSHSPDIIEEATARGIPLVLSGHLHGGQVVIPFAGPVVGMSKYGTRFAWGHFQMGSTQLIVSRGLAEEAIPLRLFCPPEIVLVTLRAPIRSHARTPSVE
jgi:predicted MPP superfamily phosphohydrolase